jgi:two-component system, NtrC family, response regulator AtoC
MENLSKQILSIKSMGKIHFDANFTITGVCNTSKLLLKEIATPAPDSQLLEFFPEFVGSEELLIDIIEGKSEHLHLERINRISENQDRLYFDFFVIPAGDGREGVLVIEDVTDYANLRREVNQQRYELFLYESDARTRKKFLAESILGKSAPIKQVLDMIHKISRVPNATVMILGNSGTGKSLTARVIHYSSMPSDAPFVDINCAALPDTLIEAELFGYEKGAFTHAVTSRAGLLQAAENGTVFLNEIGEMPMSLQAKLLSVIETKKYRRLGSNKLHRLKARIITATNRNLRAEVEQKNFREDLFHRLNVVSIVMPPLNQMGEDVLAIAEHLLKLYNRQFGKQMNGFTPTAKRALVEYDWPGNVRELSNCIERAMIFCECDTIDSQDMIIQPSPLCKKPDNWAIPPEGIVLDDVEKRFILSALQQTGGNKTKAAKLLGLSRDTLRYRIEKYCIDPETAMEQVEALST